MRSLTRWWLALIAGAFLALAAGGTWFYRAQEEQARHDAAVNLESIAQLKVNEITQWRAERLGDAAALMANPLFVEAVAHWLREPQAELQHNILVQLRAAQKAYEYSDVLLADIDGKMRLSSDHGARDLHEQTRQSLAAALSTRQPQLTDLHVLPDDPAPRCELVAPLFAETGDKTEAVGAVIFAIKADQFLYHVTQSWPIPSRTAETLFVRRDGDAVLFLNELRARPGAALKLRIPLTRTEIPAVMAVLGRRGVVEGSDYSGVEVLAALRAIPDSPWFMVTKMDVAEALQEWRFRARLIVTVIVLLAGALCSAVGMIWQQRRQYLELSRSEESVRRSEEHFRLMVEGVKDHAVILLDPSGRVASWNSGAERLNGYAAGEIVGRDISVFFLPEDVAAGKPGRLIETAARNGQVADLGWRVRKDGSRFSADVIITALRDSSGRLSGFAKVTHDITERNQTASRLKEIEDLNQTLVGAASLGILAYEAEGRCVLANEAAARVVGASIEALRAQNFRELPTWKEAGLLAAAEQALATGEPQRLEVHFVTSFKHEVYLDCALVRFASQGRSHLLMTFSDVTERQRLLAEVTRSNTDLEQFAYVASHDLKAPLRAIDSLASWLQEDLEPVLTAESRRHLALLRQRAGRMERLLDDLLTYARAGRTAAALAPVDIGMMVAEIFDLLNPPSGFVIQLPVPAPVFTTAATPLRQVITNLIANAVKHHDQPKGIIRVVVRDQGDFYDFAVEDDGPGIPSEFHERIFGMFQTLRPRDEIEGSGIGLALVKRIVTRYGGSVAVECRQPRGSVFRFRWPKEIPSQ
jgi:PAS domain S-box-containing protein